MLIRAARRGDYEEVLALIHAYSFTATALNEALLLSVTNYRHTQFSCVEALISMRADPNWRDSKGASALMLAARTGDVLLLSFLISFGGKVTQRDSKGRSCLFYALDNEVDSPEVVKLLLHCGERAGNKDHAGNSPLHCAGQFGLLDSLKVLLEHRPKVNEKNGDNQTALNLAAEHRKLDIVRELVRAGAAWRTLYSSARADVRKIIEEECVGGFCASVNCFGCGGEPELGLCSVCKVQAEDELRALAAGNEQLRAELLLQGTELAAAKEEVRQCRTEKARAARLLEGALMNGQDVDSKPLPSTGQSECSVFKLASPRSLSYSQFSEDLLQDIHCFLHDLGSWQKSVSQVYRNLECQVRDTVKQLYPECELKLFGSFPSNTHLPNSDLDMVITGATVDKRAVLLRLKAELLKQQ